LPERLFSVLPLALIAVLCLLALALPPVLPFDCDPVGVIVVVLPLTLVAVLWSLALVLGLLAPAVLVGSTRTLKVPWTFTAVLAPAELAPPPFVVCAVAPVVAFVPWL
jgi:hypothetical protein